MVTGVVVVEALFHNLFSFKGRMTRVPYFLYTATLFLSSLLFGFLWLTGGSAQTGMHLILDSLGVLAVCVISTWINFAVTAKRLHDLNWSGWHLIWVLGPSIIPVFNNNAFIGFVTGLFSIAMALFLIIAPGDKGPNRFDSSTKNID